MTNTYVTAAIIMRVKEFGESDLLVSFFTPDKGRLKGVAKGARRSRRRFVNCLETFSLVRLEYESKSSNSLYFLHSGKLLKSYAGLRSDFDLLCKASYMVELTEILFPWGISDRAMFEWLKCSLDVLNCGHRAEVMPTVFGLAAMALGGYGINTEKCCMCGRVYAGQGAAVFKKEKGGIACLKCHEVSAQSPSMGPETVRMLRILQDNPFEALKDSRLNDDMVQQMKPVLTLHRDYHIEQSLRTSRYVE
jgi:DNA repair protein RecO (recombination protein O)